MLSPLASAGCVIAPNKQQREPEDASGKHEGRLSAPQPVTSTHVKNGTVVDSRTQNLPKMYMNTVTHKHLFVGFFFFALKRLISDCPSSFINGTLEKTHTGMMADRIGTGCFCFFFFFFFFL